MASAPAHERTERAAPTAWTRVLVGAVGAIGAVVVLALAFLWPTLTMEPGGVSIGISGDADQVSQVTGAIESEAPIDLEVVRVDDRDDAVAQIERRDLLGAIVLGDAPEVLVSSAGSAQVAQSLTTMAGALQSQLQQAAQAAAAQAGVEAPEVTVEVTDVVPLSDDDPNGSGMAALGFPLVLASILGGTVGVIAIRGSWRRLGYLVALAAIGGIGLALVLDAWLGILPAPFWSAAAALGLAIAAGAGTVVGLGALLGVSGIPIAAVLLMLLGNPLSGAAVPWQFLLEPWGALGQALPPGATATLLRDVAYFPEADASAAWMTLGAWAIGGALLALVARPVVRRRAVS